MRILLLILICLLFAKPAKAQTQAELAVLAKIDGLVQLFESGKYQDVADGVESIKAETENTRNFALLSEYYNLKRFVGIKLKDRKLQIFGEFQTVILTSMAFVESSLAIFDAEFYLANSYNDDEKFNIGVEIVANNALNTFRKLKSEDINASAKEKYLKLNLFLGDTYKRTNRNELSLKYLKKSAKLAVELGFDAKSMQSLTNATTELESKISPLAANYSQGSCVATPQTTQEQITLCLTQADRADLDGNSDRALKILAELLTNVTPDRMPENLLPAASAFHFHLIEERATDDPEVIASTIQLAQKLTVDSPIAAALVTMRVASGLISNDKFNKNIADLCGHIARRANTSGNDNLSPRLLDVQARLLRIGYKSATNPILAHELEVERTLVLLEEASIAKRNSYLGLSDTYLALAETHIKGFASEPFEKINKDLSRYWNPERGYVFPNNGSAAELLGRIAMLNPEKPGRKEALGLWIDAENRYRSNPLEAENLTNRLITELRKVNEAKVTLADILLLQASFIDNPEVRNKISREAYEIYKKLPDNEIEHFTLVLEFAGTSRSIGDYDAALKLVDEASNIAEQALKNNFMINAQLLSFRSDLALDSDNLIEGIKLAEKALDLVVVNTQSEAASRINYAKDLARLYAGSERMSEARVLYEKYILNRNSDPRWVGYKEHIQHRLSLATLEAYYNPTQKILQELVKLSDLTNRNAPNNQNIFMSLQRAAAFTRYGLGEGLGAVEAARKSLALQPKFSSEKTQTKGDRGLELVIVGAAVLAANQAEVTQVRQ